METRRKGNGTVRWKVVIAKLPTTAKQKPRPKNAISVQATPSTNLTSPMCLKSSGEVAGAG